MKIKTKNVSYEYAMSLKPLAKKKTIKTQHIIQNTNSRYLNI